MSEKLLPCPLCGGAMMFRKALNVSDGNTDSIIHKVSSGCGMSVFENETIDGSIIGIWNTRVGVAPAAPVPDWQDDPSADERWIAGLDYGQQQLCKFFGVDPDDVTWDAATEELDGDIQAVIGNIMRAKFGEDWMPSDGSIYAAVSRAGTSDTEHADLMRVVDAKLGDLVEPFTADDAWHDLVEKDDRNSPEEYPEMCLITQDELRDYMQRAAPPARSAAIAAEPVAWEFEAWSGYVNTPTEWVKNLSSEKPFEAPYRRNIRPLYAAPTTSPEPDAVREALARKLLNRRMSGYEPSQQARGVKAFLDNKPAMVKASYFRIVSEAFADADIAIAALFRPAHGGWEAALDAIERLRIEAATNFKDANCQGQRGQDRTDAFYDAYQAIRALARNHRGSEAP